MKLATLIVYIVYDIFGRPLAGMLVPVYVR
jgi:hypothetical protein